MPTPKSYAAKDGTVTWRVRYRDSRDRSCSNTFDTEGDAKWFADNITARGVPFALRMLDQYLADAHDSDSPALTTVFDEFIKWKTNYVRSSRTVADYKRQYDDSIQPTLGDLPIDFITPTKISEWVEDMVSGRIKSVRTGKQLSPKTIAGRHGLLHSVMEFAADPRRAYITANPCTGAELPKRIAPAPKGLMPAEWQALHAALQQVDAGAADLAAFLIGTGFRWSEGAALTPSGIEDYGHSVYVSMLEVLRRGEGGFTSVVPEGKAQKSMRRIKVDGDVAAIIRRRVVGLAPDQPVFASADGDAWTYNEFRNRFVKAVNAANLTRRPTTHWLRHTHVGWMAMSGAPLPELQARIGHASIQTTIGVYGSMISDVKDDTLSAFAAMRSATPLQLDGRSTPNRDLPTAQ